VFSVLFTDTNNPLRTQRRLCIMLSTDDVTLIPYTATVSADLFAGPDDDENLDDDFDDDDMDDDDLDDEWEDEFEEEDDEDEVEWDEEDLSDLDDEETE
jgi:hypothetical protein